MTYCRRLYIHKYIDVYIVKISINVAVLLEKGWRNDYVVYLCINVKGNEDGEDVVRIGGGGW